MRIHISLFTRIFLAFWLTTLLIPASWFLVSRYLDSVPDMPHHAPPGLAPRLNIAVLYRLQHLERQELPGFLQRLRQRHGLVVYLLDEAGQELLRREVPPPVERLAGRLRDNRGRAVAREGRTHYVGHVIYRPGAGRVRAVLVVPPPRHPLLGFLDRNLWPRLALAVIVSGLICYAVSRAIPRRIKQLQLASRRLAGGQLNTRIPVRAAGGDETDALARDFNAMAARLEQASDDQRRLLRDVSHELRSPLTRLRLALTMAQDNPAQREQCLSRIETESDRLEALIAQLLSAQGRAAGASGEIDLADLLRRLCADAGFEAAAKDCRVSFHTALESAPLPTRGELLQRCFENILRNALKYTQPGTAVQVHLDSVGDNYHVIVEDHGDGLPEAELSRIFDEFYRTDSARGRSTGGYGLGLAIARHAACAHGGTIGARNTGGGLAVEVTVPRTGMTGAAPAEPGAA